MRYPGASVTRGEMYPGSPLSGDADSSGLEELSSVFDVAGTFGDLSTGAGRRMGLTGRRRACCLMATATASAISLPIKQTMRGRNFAILAMSSGTAATFSDVFNSVELIEGRAIIFV